MNGQIKAHAFFLIQPPEAVPIFFYNFHQISFDILTLL